MDVRQVVDELRYENRNTIWPGETLIQLPAVTRRIAGNSRTVAAFDLQDEAADSAIQEEIKESGGGEFEWKTYSYDEPSNLLEKLRNAGFEIGESESVMVYDLANGLLDEPPGCSVELVDSVERLAEYRAVAEAVFRKDFSMTTGQLADAMAAGQTSHEAYVAYVDGEPVAAGRLYTHPNSRFAGLYGGGTLPGHRGRGCYRALVAVRSRVAFDRGARYALVDAMPTSRPILERLGFVKVAETTPCRWRQPRS